MNIEQNNIMFLLSTPEVFEEYGVHQQGTQLESGKVFLHASHCGLMAIRCQHDARVVGFDQDGMIAYIEYVDGYKGGSDEQPV